MFFNVITATIASYTHGWTQLRNVDKVWAVSRDDDMYHTPSLKAATPLFARDVTTSPLDGSETISETPERSRLLIGILSCVGLVILITFVCLLLWSRHFRRVERDRSEHDTETDAGVLVSQEDKGRMGRLRPLRLWSPPANWGVQRNKSMALPIHAPPKAQRESMDLPIHAPPNSLLPSISRSLLQPICIPTTPPRAARADIHPYAQRTQRDHKDLKAIGTVALSSPVPMQLGPRSPPPTYAQATFHSLVETERRPISHLPSTSKMT